MNQDQSNNDISATQLTDRRRLLQDVLSDAHPLLEESFYMAAVPHWYDAALFTAIRNIDDDRNEGMIPRMAAYSFLIPITSESNRAYRVRHDERMYLNLGWIEQDPVEYLGAHQRAFAYLDTDGALAHPTRIHDRLYHLFFVDLVAAIVELRKIFRSYEETRRLAAIEQLLDIAAEAYQYLRLIAQQQSDSDGSSQNGSPTDSASVTLPPLQELNLLEDLITHLGARLLQMREQWAASIESLRALLDKEAAGTLSPRLAPYARRAYGNALAQTEQFVEAIKELETAIQQFQDQATGLYQDMFEVERASTMINLGETYVNFAIAARGHAGREPAESGIWFYLQTLVDFLVSIPLIIYLNFYLGIRVWHPRFWPTLRNLDWIVARLFATGASLYRQADPILERHGSSAEGMLADERLGFIYLIMGDVAQASELFEQLLAQDENTLSEYRRAFIQAELGESYLRQRLPQQARTHLEEALPILQEYGDIPTVTRVQEALAEARYLAAAIEQDVREAGEHLDKAVRTHCERKDWRRATDLIERFQVLMDNSPATIWGQGEWKTADERKTLEQAISELRGRVSELSNNLSQWVYPVGYRHPVLVLFRRLVILLLPLAAILGLLTTIQLVTKVSLAPTIEYRIAPIISPVNVAAAQLSQGVTNARLNVDVDSEATLSLLLSAVTGYLGFALLIGVAVLAFTKLDSVQRRSRSTVVQIDRNGITEGSGTEQQTIQWNEVTRLVKADARFWRLALPGHSSFGLDTPTSRLVTGGSARWYPQLRTRVSQLIPKSASVINLDYTILRSRLGLLYGINLFIFFPLAIAARTEQLKPYLWVKIPPLPYNIADLYPYLYFGLFFIPLWWSVIRPLQATRQLGKRGRLLWGMATGALLIFALQRLMLFRPLLTVPDIYPSLIVIVTLLSVWLAIWHLQLGGQKALSAPFRWGATLATTTVCIILLAHIGRETLSYHFLLYGNELRTRNLAEQAISQYERAATIGQWPLLGIRSKDAVKRSFGIPKQDNISWLLALKKQAALEAELGYGTEAEQSYSTIIMAIPDNATISNKHQLYAWRAMARERAATESSSPAQAQIEIDTQQYALALADYGEALTRINAGIDTILTDGQAELQLKQAQYHLWQGATRHTIDNLNGALLDYTQVLSLTHPQALTLTVPYTKTNALSLREKAFTGLGWLHYEEARYEEALAAFQEAAQANPLRLDCVEQTNDLNPVDESPETDISCQAVGPWLGIGYAEFKMGKHAKAIGQREDAIAHFQQADDAWHRALVTDAQDPAVLQSLGFLEWELGRLSEKPEDRCSKFAESLVWLERATVRDNVDESLAYTHRTIAQIQFAMRNCREVSDEYVGRQEAIERARDSYSTAIRLDPTNAHYWHMRARLNYSLWFISEKSPTDAARFLLPTLTDMETALEFDTVDCETPDRDYEPNRRSQGILLDAFAQARTLLSKNEQDLAINLYAASLAVSRQIENGLALLKRESIQLDDLLAQHPTLNGELFLAELDSAVTNLAEVDPSNLFSAGLTSFQQGQTAAALTHYENGLKWAIEKKWVDPVANALRNFLDQQSSNRSDAGVENPIDTLLPLLQEAFRELAPVACKTDFETALNMGFLALAVGESQQAGAWYSRAIHQVPRDGRPSILLQPITSDWRRLWNDSHSTADDLLQGLETQLSIQLRKNPTLNASNRYWLTRAEFKSLLGHVAEQVGDNATAQAARESARLDVDQLTKLSRRN